MVDAGERWRTGADIPPAPTRHRLVTGARPGGRRRTAGTRAPGSGVPGDRAGSKLVRTRVGSGARQIGPGQRVQSASDPRLAACGRVLTRAARTPAAATPAATTPAARTPAARTPAARTPAARTPAARTPAARTPAARSLGARAQRRGTGVRTQAPGQAGSETARWRCEAIWLGYVGGITSKSAMPHTPAPAHPGPARERRAPSERCRRAAAR